MPPGGIGWAAAAEGRAGGSYIVLHGLATRTAGMLLLRDRHPAFSLHRYALIAASAIGLIVFWLYPGPPELPGHHDIAAAAMPFFSRILESKAADQVGSLPSLHVTWALWVAVASQALLRHPALRAFWAYPALTVLGALATASHYTLDVITGPAVLVLAYAIPGLPAPGLRRHGTTAGYDASHIDPQETGPFLLQQASADGGRRRPATCV